MFGDALEVVERGITKPEFDNTMRLPNHPFLPKLSQRRGEANLPPDRNLEQTHREEPRP